MAEREALSLETESAQQGQACLSCRRKKAKCSRGQPCEYCRVTDSECIYTDGRKKTGAKPGYIDQLNRRMDKLENLVIGQSMLLSQCFKDFGKHGIKRKTTLEEMISTVTEQTEQLGHKRARAGDSDNPGSDNGADDGRYESTHDFYHQNMLPCESDMNQLLEQYFETVHPWIPLLHRTRTRFRMAERHVSYVVVFQAIACVMIRFSDVFYGWSGDQCAEYHQKLRDSVISQSMENFTIETLQAMVIIAFDTIGSGKGPRSFSIVNAITRNVDQLGLNVEEDQSMPKQESSRRLLPKLSYLERSVDWIQSEERRRLLWTIFLLDRFCSVSTGWEPMLAADNIHRRLPCEGQLFEAQTCVETRYLNVPLNAGGKSSSALAPGYDEGQLQKDEASLGGFAYLVEATECLSRVVTFFLLRSIDFSKMDELNNWLARFLQLDAMLISWKRSLPHKWSMAVVRDGFMDENLTLAHITHNVSVILLHQHIAYSQFGTLISKSNESALTCTGAAVEVARISQQFLKHMRNPVNPTFSFCIFVAARVLLAHAACYNAQLHEDFRTLVESLSEIARRWHGINKDSSFDTENLAMKFCQRLLQSHRDQFVEISEPAYFGSLDLDSMSYSKTDVNNDPLSLASPPLPYAFDDLFNHQGQQVNHIAMEQALQQDLFVDFPLDEMSRILYYQEHEGNA